MFRGQKAKDLQCSNGEKNGRNVGIGGLGLLLTSVEMQYRLTPIRSTGVGQFGVLNTPCSVLTHDKGETPQQASLASALTAAVIGFSVLLLMDNLRVIARI